MRQLSAIIAKAYSAPMSISTSIGDFLLVKNNKKSYILKSITNKWAFNFH